MKLLVVVRHKLNGTIWHRLVTPHMVMARLFDDIEVNFVSGIENLSDEQVREHQIFVTNYTYWDSKQFERVRRLGLKVVIDFDDYWHLEKFHQYHDIVKKYKLHELVEHCSTYGDLLTCTTKILAGKIKQLGENIEIFPNAIDPSSPSWQPSPPKDWNGIRVGYTGATEHKHDLMQIIGCENNHTIYLYEYYKLHFGNSKFKYFPFEFDLNKYPFLYDRFDYTIAPLIAAPFNVHKSELKMVESGFKRKPIIVSYVPPYTLLAKDKVNCLVVEKPKSSEWLKAMNRMSSDRNLRDELTENLHQEILRDYNLDKWSYDRMSVYSDLLNR